MNYAMTTNRQRSLKPGQRSAAGIILGGLLMFGAAYNLAGLLDYGYYRFMFQHLLPEWAAARYCGFIALRCVSILTAVGLVRQVDFYRRLAVGLAVFNLLILYWKHPYQVFFHIAVYAEMNFPAIHPLITGREVLAHPYFPLISQMVYAGLDMVFSLTLIFVLTRPGVRAKFS